MAFTNLVEKIKNNAKLPPFIICQNVLKKIPGQPCQIGRFFLLELANQYSKPIRGLGTVRDGTPSDVPGMCRLEDKEELFKKRFRENEQCIVAVHNGEVIGYVWFSDKACHLEERLKYNLVVPDDAVYSYDGFIKIENRLGGVWHLLMKYMHDQTLSRGRVKIMTMVDYGNDPSIKTHLRYGFDIIRDVYWLGMFNKIVFNAKDCEPGSFPPKKALL